MQGTVPDAVRRPSRLHALAELDANAESAAAALDRIAGTACRLLAVPTAVVNLVGADRQRFVACATADEPWRGPREMPVTQGFCPFALEAEPALAFSDARADPALAANPAVADLGVVAYAGVPLRAAGGEPVGTLCAMDRQPRRWSDDDIALLSELAAAATAELRLLAATRVADRDRARIRALRAVAAGEPGAPAAAARLASAETAEQAATEEEREYLAALAAVRALADGR